MSLGGKYIKLDKQEFENIYSNNQSLSNYVESLGKTNVLTLEQAWDAIRILLSDVVDNILGDYPLENANLGEACMLLVATEINTIKFQLKEATNEYLEERLNSTEFLNEEFYYQEYYKNKDAQKELIELVSQIKAFFNSSKPNQIILCQLG